jgi:hypothetical protein
MASPSILGSLGLAISRVEPYSTSTARAFVRTSDTGTVALTGRQIDLGKALHMGATGGKPLDATVHTRYGIPRWKSVAVAVPLEITQHTSGLNTYVTVAHQHRSATSGAGSTYATIKTDVFRFKMGTDTDATRHDGVISDCNLQAVNRYYRANVTFSWKLATSTAAKDTTTGQQLISNSPVLLFSGADSPQVSVPFKVS